MAPPPAPILRILVVAIAVAALLAVGAAALPRAWSTLALRLSADDPVALSDLRLRDALTAPRVAAEIEAALPADPELAASFVELADERAVPIDPSLRARVAAANEPDPVGALRDFADGFALGEPSTVAGLAGTLTGDLVGYGDLRDLVREGSRYARGEAADEVLLGLAVVGLAITGATAASIGGLMPVRSGVSVLKATHKGRRLSKPLAGVLAKAGAEAVDGTALKLALGAAGRLELAAAREAARASVRPQALARLTGFAEDAGTLYRRTGHRGAQQALALAQDGTELRRAAALATAKGTRTRAVLKTLGRGALALGALGTKALLWVLTALAWLFWFFWMVAAATRWLTRLLWPRRRRQPRAASTTAAWPGRRQRVDVSIGGVPLPS
ncbi:MAG TPA: hypothetical protein VM434_18795 [Beijerinckiaceae bacterium]|nr:hypothetical protein [Beijerinckiaceae bacterium]